MILLENGLAGVNRVDGGGGKYDRRSMADAQRLDVRTAAADRQLPKTLDKRRRDPLSELCSIMDKLTVLADVSGSNGAKKEEIIKGY